MGNVVNNDNVIYYITDSGMDGQAKNLIYNNSITNMSATNVQDALDTCFQCVNDGKTVLAATLTKLGITTANTDSFELIRGNITKAASYQFQLGDINGTHDALNKVRKGTAIEEEVLAGKVFTNSNASGIIGTMTNHGAVTQTLKPGGSQKVYTIPKGYHNGAGKITISPEQEKMSSMTLTINQKCYYDGDSSSNAPINVQGYNKLSRTVNSQQKVRAVELVGYKLDGTQVTLSTSKSNLTDIDISPYIYLYQYFDANKPSSSNPYYNCTFTISV